MYFPQNFDDLIFRLGLQLYNLESNLSLTFFTFSLGNTPIRTLANDLYNFIFFFNSFLHIGRHTIFIFLNFLFFFVLYFFLRPLIRSSWPMRSKLWQSLLFDSIFLSFFRLLDYFILFLNLTWRFYSLIIRLSLQFLVQLLWR